MSRAALPRKAPTQNVPPESAENFPRNPRNTPEFPQNLPENPAPGLRTVIPRKASGPAPEPRNVPGTFPRNIAPASPLVAP